MSRGAKRLQEMRENPRNDWQISDIKVVCDELGLALRPPSSGSHYKISHPQLAEILTIPAKRPIKPIYVRRLIAFADALAERNNEP
jgi:hypothetical protein